MTHRKQRKSKDHVDDAMGIHGAIHLVDLAGSERLDKSGATGAALKEAQAINTSLAV